MHRAPPPRTDVPANYDPSIADPFPCIQDRLGDWLALAEQANVQLPEALLRILSTGAFLPITSRPPLHSPFFYPFKHDITSVISLINKMAEQGIILPADPNELQHTSPAFTKEKPDHSLRFILDLSFLNNFMSVNLPCDLPQPHAFPNVHTGPSAVGQVIDLKSGFFSCKLSQEDQSFTGFVDPLGRVWKMDRLPMGSAASPSLFQLITSTAAAIIESLIPEIRISVYQDDFLITTPTWDPSITTRVVSFLKQLGFSINPAKLHPWSHHPLWLGCELDLVQGHVTTPLKRLVSIRRDCKQLIKLLAKNAPLSPKRLASTIGKLTFISPNWPPLLMAIKPLAVLPTPLAKRHGWNCPLDFDPNLTKCLSHALHILSREQLLVPLVKQPPSLIISSDASRHGFGYTIQDLKTRDVQRCAKPWTDSWLVPSHHHINKLELMASLEALRSIPRARLRNSTVLMRTDSQVAAAWQKSRRATWSARSVLWTYMELIQELRVTLQVQWVPGELLSEADSLSRQHQDTSHFALPKETMVKIIVEAGMDPHATVEVFASQVQHHLILRGDQLDPQRDAMSMWWAEHQSLWIFPAPRMWKVFLPLLMQAPHFNALCLIPSWSTPQMMTLKSLGKLVATLPLSELSLPSGDKPSIARARGDLLCFHVVK